MLTSTHVVEDVLECYISLEFLGSPDILVVFQEAELFLAFIKLALTQVTGIIAFVNSRSFVHLTEIMSDFYRCGPGILAKIVLVIFLIESIDKTDMN